MTDRARARPQVTLKLATSLDGRIATRTGESQWITGPQARAKVHQMRAAHDCILTGIGTVLADDPLMTARTDPPPSAQPLRAVLDTRLRTPQDSQLLRTLDLGPVCLFHDKMMAQRGEQANLLRFGVPKTPSGLDLVAVLEVLQTTLSIDRVMIEAGSGVAGAFLRAGLVDTFVWFRAPIILGGDGAPVFTALGVDELAQAIICQRQDIEVCGHDVMETYTLTVHH